MHISVRYVVSELWCSHLGAAGFVVGRGGQGLGVGEGMAVVVGGGRGGGVGS